ncbi:MAG: sensor domain-containing diguanylate cyclase [Burkholderiales bacterium]
MNDRSPIEPDAPPSPDGPSLPERMEIVTRIARRLFRAPVAVVSLASKGTLRVVACEGLPASVLGAELAFDREVLRSDGPLVIPDLIADPRFCDHPWVAGALRLRFYAGAVLAPDGRPAGVLAVADREPNSLATADLLMLRDLARLAETEVQAGLRERARDVHSGGSADQPAQQVFLDARTRLWSRHAMYELIDREFHRSRRERDAVAAIVVDIDRLTGIEGEEADTVIAEVARRLRDVVRRSDIIGRAHGNRLLIFLGRCNLENAVKLAERMRHGTRKLPVQVGGDSVPITVALGVAASEAGSEWAPDQLLRVAEEAVGDALAAGGDTVVARPLD